MTDNRRDFFIALQSLYSLYASVNEKVADDLNQIVKTYVEELEEEIDKLNKRALFAEQMWELYETQYDSARSGVLRLVLDEVITTTRAAEILGLSLLDVRKLMKDFPEGNK